MLAISTVGNQTVWDTPVNVGAQVPLSISITENDASLKNQEIRANIAWGNGIFSTYSGTGGLLVVKDTVALSPGQYFVQINARNARFPTPNEISAVLPITVNQLDTPPPPLQYVYGPILPRDNGFPNDAQWSFNRGADLEILESSAKMLLSTAKGERRNNPNYGTNIQQLVFSQDTSTLRSSIQDEITSALATYEPRVALQSLNISLPNPSDPTTIVVTIVLISLIGQSQIILTLPFSAG